MARKNVPVRQSRPAQAMVEFAIVLPVLVMVVFAIIEMSYTFFQTLTVSRAAREGARAGAVNANDNRVRQVVQDTCGGFDVPNDNNSIQITVTNSQGVNQNAGDRTSGNRIKVQVTHSVKYLTPIQGTMKAAGLDKVKASATVMID